MKRVLAVTLGGVALTFLLIALGMGAVFSYDPAWRATVTELPNREPFDVWLTRLNTIIQTLLVLVFIPTALLVGFLVGRFSGRYKMTCAIIASCPAWAPLLFITVKTMFICVGIAGVAAFGARVSEWVSPRFRSIRSSGQSG